MSYIQEMNRCVGPTAVPKGMKVGGKYNWKNQPERLVYLGDNLSGNGYWHQFAKIDSPSEVWCEVKGYDLGMLEETK